MKQTGRISTLAAALLALAVVLPLAAARPGSMRGREARREHIRVDLPVRLAKADVVFDLVSARKMHGKPMGLMAMKGLAEQFKKDGTPHSLVGVFYGKSGAWVLRNEAYNRLKGVTTGNPYRKLVKRLEKLGVQMDVCAVWMHRMHLTNADLLPGVKTTNNAYLRIIQLQQRGYVKMEM